jgi:hypothetical protein
MYINAFFRPDFAHTYALATYVGKDDTHIRQVDLSYRARLQPRDGNPSCHDLIYFGIHVSYIKIIVF